MSEAEIAAPDVESRAPVELPGQYLSRARASHGLSVADIARTLKFSERQIEALERDDYQSLSGATFVRGFIRGYARILKIDPAPLIAMLEAGAPLAAVEVVAPGNMGDAAPRPFMRRHGRRVGLALIILGAVAVAGFWLPGFLDREPAVTRSPAVLAVPSAATSAAETVAPAVPMAPAVPAISAAAMQLMVDFDDKSWIEIKDAADNVLLTGEYPSGFHQAISGRAPFQLWIGNAPAVHVTQDGHPVDLAPYTRDSVARLTVN